LFAKRIIICNWQYYHHMKEVEVGASSAHGRDETCIQNLVRKLERKRSLGRCRHRWKSNMKADIPEISSKNVDRIHLAWSMVQLRDSCEHGN
jgi:isopropylmalate/homocitrate/citramalate synthase